jgi:hypothetical protein
MKIISMVLDFQGTRWNQVVSSDQNDLVSAIQVNTAQTPLAQDSQFSTASHEDFSGKAAYHGS